MGPGGALVGGLLLVALSSGCLFRGAVKPRMDSVSGHHPVNRLAQSASPYLRSAAHQPIGWFEWGEEAFQAAQALDRPILLDVGAVWCHWCHVMDRESYEHDEIARLINERFVPVKVDVDARPDIDRRYQEIVSAMTGQGGWPLTVVLTPTGEVIYGGTYFPPSDRWGMPGMQGLLMKIAELYRSKKPEILSQARRLHEEMGQHREEAAQPGEVSPARLDQLVASLKNRSDAEHGGFGDAPKFPSASALELAMQLYARRGDRTLLEHVTVTLDRMAAGGIRDQLAGAFHRYSVDRFWRVPHFEILLSVNAELLLAYVHGFQLTHRPRYREVAEGIIQYVTAILSDQARGGFYGSQDADYSPDDDGDYYTWTVEEAKAALTPEAFEVLSRYYDIQPQGEMREHPSKNVLFEAVAPEAVAKELTRPVPEIEAIIARGREQLLAARRQRRAPFVDPTLYVHWNGLMISAYLEAAEVFDRADVQAFALKTLDRLLDQAWRPGTGVSHTVVEGLPGVPGLLEDYAQLALACTDAYQATQDPRYVRQATALTDEMVRRFWDASADGFVDLEVRPGALAVLREPRKPIQDAPTPSGNGIAILLLQRMATISGEARYGELAQRALRAFVGYMPAYGVFTATLGRGLDLHLHPPAHVIIVGAPTDPAAQALWQAARHVYHPGQVIQMVDLAHRGGPATALPEPVRELVRAAAATARPSAYVCVGTTCRPPVADPSALTAMLTMPASGD